MAACAAATTATSQQFFFILRHCRTFSHALLVKGRRRKRRLCVHLPDEPAVCFAAALFSCCFFLSLLPLSICFRLMCPCSMCLRYVLPVFCVWGAHVVRFRRSLKPKSVPCCRFLFLPYFFFIFVCLPVANKFVLLK